MLRTRFRFPFRGAGWVDASLVDLMIYDGLTCSFDGVHMGNYGNLTAKELGISRAEQDEWALVSHRRAVAALDSGKLQEEMVPVEVPQRKGPALTIHEDEAPRRDTSLEKLAKLKPVFDADGTITAGNAPGINDGACALVLMEEDEAKKQGIETTGKNFGERNVALEAKDFPKTPGLVINKLLRKTGKKVSDIDLFEINEAFAVVTLAAAQIAVLDLEKVNVNGGSDCPRTSDRRKRCPDHSDFSLRITTARWRLGIAAICSGGGQGDAILIEVPAS